MIWVWLVIAAIIAAPFLREALRPKMDSNARSAAPGGFVTLSDGVTHYRWLGPSRGPVAVCVHGLTTPSFVWQLIAVGLAEMGFRVLVYDLYGRGYSDRPRRRHTRALFHRQLGELLADQRVKDDITLLGYSMGGSIAASWAAANPSRLRRLILLAPAGMGHDLGTMARITRGVPILGDWLMLVFFPKNHRRGTEAERPIAEALPGIIDYQQDELEWRGFVPAVLSSLRGMLSEVLEEDHRTITRMDIPTLAIWGRDDSVIPIRAMGVMTQWNRTARHEVIDGAGHGLAYTHAPEVISAIAGEVARG